MTTIDGVIDRLDDIIEEAVAAGDRRGYFAALYNRVTMRMRDGIQRGEFQDGARMERFDVIFAGRYLDAYDGYEQGALIPGVWQRAFDAAQADGLLVIQHLLLGMNAHITLDLGVAAATVAPGSAIADLAVDFHRINDLLASLVGTVEDELVAIAGRWEAPLGVTLRIAELACHGGERTAAGCLMDGARAAAWRFAQEIAGLDPDARAARIRRQDEEATLLSEAMLLGPAKDLLPPNRDVAGYIRILAQGELPL
jgi:hypothetical protein